MFFRSNKPTVAIIRLNGVIGQMGPLRSGMTMQTLAPVIDRAFSDKRLKAVALAVNSPGGSPVQSALIHQRIRSLAREKDIPILVFIEDVAASGGYWLACAGDEIYANENSIIGSIGVVSAGFGFVGLLEKAGIDRRLYTAGSRKSLLDPFLPEEADDVARLRAIQQDIHENFKTLVKSRRGRRLQESGIDLFSGEFWTGSRAMDLGLVDGISDMRTVLRDRFGKSVRLKTVQVRKGWLKRRLGVSGSFDTGDQFGYGIGAGLVAAAEERANWSRFGL
jgi:serine protease SohB